MFKNFKSAKPIPAIIILVAALILLFSVLLPYATANKELKEELQEISESKLDEDSDFKAKSLIRVSLLEASKVNKTFVDVGGALYVVFTVTIMIFAFIIALFANFKKPFFALLFNIISFLLFSILKSDFANIGILTNENYNAGIGFYLIHFAFIGILVGSVWMLIKKKDL